MTKYYRQENSPLLISESTSSPIQMHFPAEHKKKLPEERPPQKIHLYSEIPLEETFLQKK